MRLNVQVSLEMRFVCVQCQKDMVIRGLKEKNPEPMLECPECGFKIQVFQTMQLPGIPGTGSRFPKVKPRKF